ncbi:hypothetical protein [Mycolicibacterium fortuitum]|uniref:hypothetical protein n=1 Tax=Mycolicibacterium fortuitum TaxID=1766 RepID=UPI003AAF05D7
MISTYSRGNVTLTVEQTPGEGEVTFTIVRTAALTDDDVRRINAELADYPAARGAQLMQLPHTDEWVVGAGAIVATDQGDPTAELRWVSEGSR